MAKYLFPDPYRVAPTGIDTRRYSENMLSHGEEQVARYYDEQIYEAEIARLPREFPVEMRITKRFLAKWIQPGMTVAEAGWCRQVQGFGQGNETGPQVVQFLESCQQVRHGSAPTLQAPHQHHVDFAAARRIQQPLPQLPLTLGAPPAVSQGDAFDLSIRPLPVSAFGPSGKSIDAGYNPVRFP